MAPDDLAYLDALGVKPREIVITNRNHVRDSGRWGLPRALHEAEDAGFEPQRRLKEGDVVGPGLEVLHVPGKSPGEIALLWRAKRLLVLGDALVGPGGRLRVVPDAKIDDKPRLLRSIGRLAELEFDALLLADGDPILRGAREAVRAFAASAGAAA